MVTATAKPKSKPKALDQAAKDQLLRSLLTMTEGNESMLKAAATSGMDEAALKSLVTQCLPESGGVSIPGVGHACARSTLYGSPVWFGSHTPPAKKSADLSGQKLVDAVRRLYWIETPEIAAKRKTSADVQAGFEGPPASTSVLTPQRIKPGKNGHIYGHAKNGVGNGQLPTQNGHAPAADAVTPPAAGRLAIVEEVEIRIEAIKPSPENPREDYDQAFLEQLGQSILDHGLLTPLLVRHQGIDGKYEIIDGETRWRAATLKKISGLRCSIVECTDAEAALARVLSYRQRRDLNPLEEARGLQLLLQKYGCSQRELEEKIGLSQGQISNRIRLLRLPKPWQKRVISGEITASQARDLAVWADEPKVLEEIEENHYDQPFEDRLIGALHSAGHALKGWDSATGKDWKIDGAIPDLRVKEVPSQYGSGKVSLAFNFELAEQLKTAAVEKLKRSAAKRAEKSEASAKGAASPAEKKRKAVQLAEQLNKKIYRYKVAWLQRRILERLQDEMYSVSIDFLVRWVLWFACQHENAGKREDELEEILGKGLGKLLAAGHLDSSIASMPLRKTLAAWCTHSFEGYRTDFPPATVEAFAENAGIDLAKEWRLDEEFLELFTKGGLIQLVEEWKLGMYFIVGTAIETMKRGEIIAKVLELEKASKSKGMKPPKCLLKVKEVSLT